MHDIFFPFQGHPGPSHRVSPWIKASWQIWKESLKKRLARLSTRETWVFNKRDSRETQRRTAWGQHCQTLHVWQDSMEKTAILRSSSVANPHPFLDDFHVKKIKKVYLQVTTGPISACSRHNASANSNMACSWRKELRARWQGVAKPLRITKARLLVSTTRPKKPAKMVTLKGLNSWLNDVQPIRKKTKPPKGSFLEWRYPIPPKKDKHPMISYVCIENGHL